MPQLIQSTKVPDADKAIQAVIATFENAFPNRIHGYYIEGSYANQTAVATSDIDLSILFLGSFATNEEQAQALHLAAACEQSPTMELDITLIESSAIDDAVPPTLWLGSLHVYGQPLPADWPLVSVEVWGKERMHAVYWLLTKVYKRPNYVRLPRNFPRPDAEFYGYTDRTVEDADGNTHYSTRDLIRVMGWAATARIALEGQHIVARKSDCHLLYRQIINDEWTPFIDALHTYCRTEWQYLIPTAPAGRQRLKEICVLALAFENHFLSLYKRFVLKELAEGDDTAKNEVLRLQREIPFIDLDIQQSINVYDQKNGRG